MENITLDNYNSVNFKNKKIESYGFFTENSKDISYKLLLFAEKVINRSETIEKLSQIFKSYIIAKDIEKGIFEFALVHITINCLNNDNVKAIYDDKFYDIFSNLTDSNTFNSNLKQSVYDGSIKPYYVSFLSPQQLCPESWSDIINKNKYIEETENNVATTDIYECYKCGSRKFTIRELQIRSSDEPSTKFITCTVCLKTFCK